MADRQGNAIVMEVTLARIYNNPTHALSGERRV